MRLYWISKTSSTTTTPSLLVTRSSLIRRTILKQTKTQTQSQQYRLFQSYCRYNSASSLWIPLFVSPNQSFHSLASSSKTKQQQQPNNYPTSLHIIKPHIPSKHNTKHKSTSSSKLGIKDTPLGKPECASLLNGLDVYSVPALDDAHPITVYGIHSNSLDNDNKNRKPILLLHGRTWSSVPVYHLLGGSSGNCKNSKSRSLMEALYDAGLQPYALDFRGFGGTPPTTTTDHIKKIEPNRCVQDSESVLCWIASRHGLRHDTNVEEEEGESGLGKSYCEMPALLGWSQGALVSQLLAQKSPHLLSKLLLYGSIYDPQIHYPRPPLYGSLDKTNLTEKEENIKNDYDMAIEDFTIEGTIPHEPAKLFAEAALKSDPVKVKWVGLFQFNNCDPARVNVPTLVVVGDQDPYAPLRVQGELFANLGRGADRQWSIISGADHAVHLLDGRARFVKIVKSFVENGTSS